MLFLSGRFFLFWPVTALGYHLVPRRWKAGWLLAASWFFYLCAGAAYFPVLLFVVLSSYAAGRLLERRPRRGLLALAVLSPVLLLIALAVVIDDPKGGPLFTQTRCGQWGKEFRLCKFRTMSTDAEQRLEELLPYNEMTGPAFKIRNDPRATRFGKILRSMGLDELPQLLNILRGGYVHCRPPAAAPPGGGTVRAVVKREGM